MVNGRDDGVYEMQPSPMLVGFAVTFLGALLAVGGWIVTNQIQLVREISNLGGDVRSVRAEIDRRVAQRDAEHVDLVNVDAEAAAKIEALRLGQVAIKQRLDFLVSGQIHNRNILEKLPGAREETR